MTIEVVQKRNGELEKFDINKILRWELWACNDVKQYIDWKDIIIKVKAQLYDRMSTQDIMIKLIEECNNRKSWFHSLVAGRLYAAYVTKKLYGSTDHPTLKDQHEKMRSLNLMSKLDYTDQDYAEMQSIIDHSKDYDLSYLQIYHMVNKYGLSDRVSKIQYETPQFIFGRMAMALAEDEKKDRLKVAEGFYKYISGAKINAPTPNYVNLGTPHNGYISCCLYTTDDTAASIGVGDHIAYTMTYMSAGIGGFLNIRSLKDKVKNGMIRHMGKLPYFKSVAGAVNASLQSCYTSDTEILTEKGFIPFTELTGDLKVAQVHNSGDIDFVVPQDIINTPYKGKIYRFSSNRNMGVDIAVTPNHRMTWRKCTKIQSERMVKFYGGNGWYRPIKNYMIDGEYTVTQAEDFYPSRETVIDFGGRLTGKQTELTPIERLHIAFQADGLSRYTGDYVYMFRFTKKRKIERLKSILDEAGIEYKETLYKDGVTAITAKVGVPFTKDFSGFTLSDKSDSWCVAFLREAAYWDGNLAVDSSMDAMSYCNTNETAVRFVQSVAASCGAYSHETVLEPTHQRHNHLYRVYISFDRSHTSGRAIIKQVLNYDGTVHCVTVPTGNIVIRRNGKTAVCGNSRGGACTQYFTAYDPEATDIVFLQNPRTPISKQNRDLHFAMMFNTLFVEKFFKDEKMFTFNKFTAPDLMEALFSGKPEKFKEIYLKYENDPSFVKNYVSVREFALTAFRQSHEVATLYQMNADEVNRHTPFKEPIYQSNLCLEILQPTKPYYSMEDLYSTELHERGEISLCALGGIVPSNINSDEEYEEAAYYSLLMIDKCIHKNHYVFPHLELTAKARMNAAVGMIGIAHELARKGLKYNTKEGLEYIHFLAERHMYYLIKASLKLGKELGNAPWIHKTKWPDGWMPIDTYNRNIDKIADFKLHYDWETLRQEVIANGGIHNSILCGHMPTEGCLSSNTKVRTKNGVMSLEDIFKMTGFTLDQASERREPLIGGEWYDLPETVQVETRFGYKDVKRVWYNGQTPHMKITLENGDVIECTHRHKFLVRNQGNELNWVYASDLNVDDDIVDVTEK